MSGLELSLILILAIIGIILIILIIIQSGRVKNLGSSIVGTKDVDLFQHKKRGWEKILHWITLSLVILFVLVAFILIFI
ncbi:MAG: hypothetical protein TYPL_0640 [Candidatus Tyloplasma litorale]|nr:MAG: hypothetical protein TYPL_0640 [Mycoplasmatales bacterium]